MNFKSKVTPKEGKSGRKDEASVMVANFLVNDEERVRRKRRNIG